MMGKGDIEKHRVYTSWSPLLLFFFFFLIHFWLPWVFIAARGLSLVAASGGYSS